SDAIVGAIWKPLAPAPTTATRLPRTSTEWSQRAEWNDGPAKSSRPGMSGSGGRLSWPTAEMTARARSQSSRPSLSRTVTARLAAADDDHGKRLLGRVVGAQLDAAGVDAVELELLEHQGHVVLGDLLAGEEAHHLAHEVVVRWRREDATVVAVRGDGDEGAAA